ncbi:MAG TPA: MMPL family transporter [Acidimicrobiales bacterium]|nr:MMPL family transporter [Acidimicrobiales bacterium]
MRPSPTAVPLSRGADSDPLEEHRLFAALGRFTVRYRWPIIVAWVIVTVILVLFLPSLSSVEKSSNSDFLPSSSASVKAGELAAPLQAKHNAQATYVAVTNGRSLSPADTASIDRVERAIRSVPRVTSVIDQGVSADGRAREAIVEFDGRQPATNRDTARAVAQVRAEFRSPGTRADLVMHLTGGVAQSVDQQNQSGQTQTLTEVLSLLFILALLFLTFRALLAPFVALIPSVVALLAAGPLVAESTHIGVQVSDLTPILLTVVMLGAGTDYGLFLIFRVREELRRGRPVGEAVAFSLCKVGESITFSGFTVIAALAAVVVATFGLYRGLGPGLAIGIAVALLANLTLLPALLAVLGRAVFWPRVPKVGPARHGTWGRIAGRVVARPLITLLVGLVFFGGLAVSMLAYAPTGFGDQPPAATSDSARGQAVLDANYPSTEANPTTVLFRLPTSVWAHPDTLITAQLGLERSGVFRAVSGALDPNGTMASPEALVRAHRLLARYGPAATLPSSTPARVALSPAEYDAYRATALFISADGRTIRYDATLRAGASTSTAAAQAIPAIRAAVANVATAIGATANGVDGYAPAAADVGTIAGQDLVKILPIVLLVLALLLAIVLRSLVAPIYLVISVGLSYLASLGLAVLVFELAGGQDGINFVLPFFMFVFIMALGQDYNILVMTRIREEAHHAPIRVAVRRAVEATGTTVTSAGLILAGTFGVLTATGNTQVKEIGLGLAAGILLDTFFVRTLLVPSVVVLLGRWNWWPSALSREDHSHDPVIPDDAVPDGAVEDLEPLVRPLAGTSR